MLDFIVNILDNPDPPNYESKTTKDDGENQDQERWRRFVWMPGDIVLTGIETDEEE